MEAGEQLISAGKYALGLGVGSPLRIRVGILSSFIWQCLEKRVLHCEFTCEVVSMSPFPLVSNKRASRGEPHGNLAPSCGFPHRRHESIQPYFSIKIYVPATSLLKVGYCNFICSWGMIGISLRIENDNM